MRVMAAAVTAAALAAATVPAATAARADDAEIERLVRQHVQPMLIAAGGMAVAVHIEGRTLSFNYGLADVARKEPITSDVLFNLASVGKVFISTLLAQAVKRGEVALDDPVAKYVTSFPTSSAISTPGRPTTRMRPASRTSIPTPASCCFRSRCSAASTPRSRSSWTRGCFRRSA